MFNDFPRLNGDYLVYDCGDNALMRLYTGAGRTELEQCAEQLSVSASLYDTAVSGTLTQYTYRLEEGIMYLSLDESSGRLCIIRDGATALYKKTDEAEMKCQTQLYQFEVDHSLIDCGMCYIIRCCDNSFFVIDSAHTYSVNDNNRLHDFLRSLTPEGERIRIAGWFFSHGHVDHVGKFADYLRYNCEDTDIETLYYNIVPSDHRDNGCWMESDKNFTENFRKITVESGIPIVKLHSGQCFAIRNLSIDVLCTHEDVFPAPLNNYNDSSTVLMVHAEGTRILFPGDAGDEESRILEQRIGDGLRCDIVQVAHHGHFGTSTHFYELANASVALFATTQIKYDEELPNYEANRKAVELAHEYYIASNGTVKIPLPYKRGETVVLPDETFEDFDGIYGLWGYEYTTQRKQELYDAFIKASKKA